jgi:cob(I)alamin adenosyltransferase
MTNELYEKAVELKKDIKAINKQIEEVKMYKHWITTSTPDYESRGASSRRFQEELIDWLEQKMNEYQKEFDELGCE